ncbi:hypothetical protein FGO68_gene1340 [Halteria grandinella]|uniref:Uncharacterized protein n=1 Tax=Halteria grandinella TaxID=5974 RepID=A0A8J8N913_HALGN|nr:hypothetical protein FGO68_gene1340 [Halteria grandinella]
MFSDLLSLHHSCVWQLVRGCSVHIVIVFESYGYISLIYLSVVCTCTEQCAFLEHGTYRCDPFQPFISKRDHVGGISGQQTYSGQVLIGLSLNYLSVLLSDTARQNFFPTGCFLVRM